jgi:nucleotide-binding universal stress UspA family protein
MLAEFGSVARYAFQHSPVPVLLVPPGVLACDVV